MLATPRREDRPRRCIGAACHRRPRGFGVIGGAFDLGVKDVGQCWLRRNWQKPRKPNFVKMVAHVAILANLEFRVHHCPRIEYPAQTLIKDPYVRH
jgi:hypothetical protein